MNWLLETVFPGAFDIGDLVGPNANPSEAAVEEPYYRALLLSGRATGAEIDRWLARVVARRSLRPSGNGTHPA